MTQQKLATVFVVNQLNYLPAVDLPLQTMEKVNNFFTSSKTKNNQQPASGCLDSPPTACSDTSSLNFTQTTMESCFTISAVRKAEIILWIFKTADSGFSVRPNDDINNVFSTMFSDSSTASEFRVARAKTMYEITHELAPYFKSILIKSDVYVYSFNDSWNQRTQTSKMDLYVRYWDVSSQVKARYFESSFLGLSFLTHFNQIAKELNASKITNFNLWTTCQFKVLWKNIHKLLVKVYLIHWWISEHVVFTLFMAVFQHVRLHQTGEHNLSIFKLQMNSRFIKPTFDLNTFFQFYVKVSFYFNCTKNEVFH